MRQVLGVFVTDNTGTEAAVDPSVYTVTRQKSPCRVRLNPGQVWPYHRGFECFRIQFSCGYACPFTVSSDQVTINAGSTHGYASGDVCQFSSHDGTLPSPLEYMQPYTVTNLDEDGTFQITDMDGNLITEIDPQWQGTGFLGEVPSPLLEAVTFLSALNQAGEVPSRIPGVSGASRLSPIQLPVTAAEMVEQYVWPEL